MVFPPPGLLLPPVPGVEPVLAGVLPVLVEPPVFGDEDRLVQVFHNLVRNAVEAMADGGRVTLATRVSRNPLFGKMDLGGGPRSMVEAQVIDEGSGMFKLSGQFDPELGTRIWRAIDQTVAINYPPDERPETVPDGPEAADHLAALALADVISAAYDEDDARSTPMRRPARGEFAVLADRLVPSHGHALQARSIDVYVHRLRDRLRKAGAADHDIEAVRGRGYRLCALPAPGGVPD